MIINTTRGPAEEGALLKREGVVDETDDQTTSATEYCELECLGQSHRTGIKDSPGHFCNAHIHRSVHVTMKRWPEGLAPAIQEF